MASGAKMEIKNAKQVKIILIVLTILFVGISCVLYFAEESVNNFIFDKKYTYPQELADWNQRYEDRVNELRETTDASEYAEYVNDEFKGFYYEFLVDDPIEDKKQLHLRLTNMSDKNVNVRTIRILLKENHDVSYDFGAYDILNDYVVISLQVPADLNITNYDIRIYDSVKSEWNTVYHYREALEITKEEVILDIARNIGAYPEDNSERLRMDIEDSVSRAAGLTLFSAVVCVLILIFVWAVYYGREEEKEPAITVIHKTIRPKKKTKKVCLYCESFYFNNLDKCPNCGSTLVEEEDSE